MIKNHKLKMDKMNEACVLIEAFKQLMDPNANKEANDPSNPENDLVNNSKKSALKARSILSKVVKKDTGKIETSVKKNISMIFYCPKASINNGKLRVFQNVMNVIVQGSDYFSVNVDDAIKTLKLIITTNNSVKVALRSSDGVELREVTDVKCFVTNKNSKIIEFNLESIMTSEGKSLNGNINDLKIFFGILPTIS